MAKYKFIKPYSATVTIGGFVGVTTRAFQIGDEIDGTPVVGGIETRIAPHSVVNEGLPSNTSYQETITIPNEYLEKVSNMPNMKNIAIISLLIIALIALFFFIIKPSN